MGKRRKRARRALAALADQPVVAQAAVAPPKVKKQPVISAKPKKSRRSAPDEAKKAVHPDTVATPPGDSSKE